MIAAWMLHAIAVTLLASAAGLALDRLLRRHRLPVRWIWAGVLTFGSGLPLVRLVDGNSAVPGGAPPAAAPAATLEAIRPTVTAGSPLHGLEPVLLGAWALLTVALLARLLRGTARLKASSRECASRTVCDSDVLVHPDFGPAAIGLLRPRIVVPEWMLDEDPRRLELSVLHEEEHIRRRDPLLIALGSLVVLCFPWNPGLWWAFRRLREAVEVDCDGRVLARRPDALRAYARTLVELGRRRAGIPAGPAPAFVRPRSFLERRIRTMTSSRPKRPLVRALVLGSVSLLALAGACLAPDAREGEAGPAEVESSQARIPDPPGEVAGERLTYVSDIRNAREVMEALRDEYPPLLREAGVEGTAEVWFYIDETGTTRDVRIRESAGHEALDRAALRVAQVFDFTASRDESGPVAVWIALPITFELD